MGPEQMEKAIGRAARQMREALGLTQEAVAERIGVSTEFYSRVEHGKSLPSLRTLVRLAVSLDVSIDHLIGNTSDGTGPHQGHGHTSDDSPEMRRLMRRLRNVSPITIRVVALIVNDIDRAFPYKPDGEGAEDDEVLRAMGPRITASDPFEREFWARIYEAALIKHGDTEQAEAAADAALEALKERIPETPGI